MKNLNLLLFTSVIALSSCVKEPVACIDDLPDEILVFEVLEVSAGCSSNSETYEWSSSNGYFGQQLKEGETAKFTWNTPGLKDITLEATNSKGEDQAITKSINVIDICYSCIYNDTTNSGYYYDQLICSGLFGASSKEEFEYYIQQNESMGYNCTKQ
jgi:hypothetical protein